MAGIFKAYDIRGIVPDELDEAIAERIGRAFPLVLDEADRGPGSAVVVGRDMRVHSEPLAEAVIRGLTAAGLDVIDIGMTTTPMNYFAVGHLGAAGGIQVTASHNPGKYNGMKMSRREARPVSGDAGIPLLERAVAQRAFPTLGAPGARRRQNVFEAYGEKMLSYLEEPSEGANDGLPLRVVVDAANGMGTIYRPLLERMGLELVPLFFELDGTFPNHEANPLKLENLRDACRAVRESGADLGVAFDGDADRAAFIDETGEPVGSDLMTALIAGPLLERYPGKAVVYDLRSSRAVPESIAEKGGVPVRERVGHSFIKATLRKRDAAFGGELAGHYYFRDNYFADAALLAVIEVLNLLRRDGATLSKLVEPLRRYAKSPEINFQVEDKQAKLDELAERYGDGAIDRLDGITITFDDWWMNVRPSNTEPYLRLVMEADTPELLAEHQAEVTALLGEPV